MKLLAILALLALPLDGVGASTQYHSCWHFTELTNDYHYEDYSNDLGNTLAITLPVEAVKAGWACVREPVQNYANIERGWFSCTNGIDQHFISTACYTDRINTGYEHLELTLPGAPNGIELSVSCTVLPQ